MRSVESSIAFVTGAKRGIEKAIVEELLARGAAKVYAGVRNPDSARTLLAQHGSRVVPLKLDVINKDDVAAAAVVASDVQILVNNAGIVSGTGRSFLLEDEQGFPDDMARDIQRQYGEEPKKLEINMAAMAAAG